MFYRLRWDISCFNFLSNYNFLEKSSIDFGGTFLVSIFMYAVASKHFLSNTEVDILGLRGLPLNVRQTQSVLHCTKENTTLMLIKF